MMSVQHVELIDRTRTYHVFELAVVTLGLGLELEAEFEGTLADAVALDEITEAAEASPVARGIGVGTTVESGLGGGISA